MPIARGINAATEDLISKINKYQNKMPESLTKSLAEILQEAKGDRSCRQFARDIGSSHTTLRRILSGGTPDIPTLQKIAKASQYSTHQLVEALLGHPEASVAPPPPTPKRTPKQVCEIARNFSLEERKQLITLLFAQASRQERRELFQRLLDFLL